MQSSLMRCFQGCSWSIADKVLIRSNAHAFITDAVIADAVITDVVITHQSSLMRATPFSGLLLERVLYSAYEKRSPTL